jgi:uncharacterized protein (DUF488 family)
MKDSGIATQTGNPHPVERPLYTIGHSNHDWASFLALLRSAGVTVVADVRSSPFSRRFPQFSRDVLEARLKSSGIAYLFLGGELGGRPADGRLYDGMGRVDYEKVRQTAAFQLGLELVVREMGRATLAVLCSEEDPRDCHRGLMITPALREFGVSPLHLRRDGSVETTDDLELDLLAAAGLGAARDGLLALMLSPDERREALADAYRHMAARKAYQLETESLDG